MRTVSRMSSKKSPANCWEATDRAKGRVLGCTLRGNLKALGAAQRILPRTDQVMRRIGAEGQAERGLNIAALKPDISELCIIEIAQMHHCPAAAPGPDHRNHAIDKRRAAKIYQQLFSARCCANRRLI